MKKAKLLLALCLAGSMANAQVTELVTNGSFESYNTLPNCSSTTFDLPDVNNWSTWDDRYHWNLSTCSSGWAYGGAQYKEQYFNNSTGGTGSCEGGVTPHGGNGFVFIESRGYNQSQQSDGVNIALTQAISSTLYAAKKYMYTAYIQYNNSSDNAIPTLSSSSTSFGTVPTVTVTGAGPWYKLQAILTVPSDGSYYLVIGHQNRHCSSSIAWNFYIDDVSLQELCAADAGSNVSDQNTACCLCTTTGVSIGTTSVMGLTYSWAPSANISGSSTIAQPTAIWCNTSTPKIYTVTVSGSTCVTNTSTVQVTTNAFQGTFCCRLANPNSSANGEINTIDNVSITVFPNPATGQVTISLNEKAEYLRIADMQGRLVYETKNIDAGELKIDIAKYNKGIYFISAKLGDKIEKQKLVVE